MPYQLQPFDHADLTPALVDSLIAGHEQQKVPHLRTLWRYYRNPISIRPGSNGPFHVAQSDGLPSRLTRPRGRLAAAGLDDRLGEQPEIVVENDIAWRIHTMVDFMFGRPLRLISTARDPDLAERINVVLDAIWEGAGGIRLLQDMALLGHIYGSVDLLVKIRAGFASSPLVVGSGSSGAGDELAIRAAAAVTAEPIDPLRGIPVVHPDDPSRLDAYVLRFTREVRSRPRTPNAPDPTGRFLGLVRRRNANAASFPEPSTTGAEHTTVTTILSEHHWQTYESVDGDPVLVGQGPNGVSPGVTPVVHIQNVSQPFTYEGLSEVEPLIAIQNELNTRLSDRARRVTMQSFKMYLAKGLDGFDQAPVGPGQVWQTDNPDASIEGFGADAASPSEDAHIEQIREAIDKISGVPPLATGVVRARVGNLTSENALRITLTGLLSRTARKRVTYGRGLADACRFMLTALDELRILRSEPADRGVRVEWPDPLPRDERDVLGAARQKIELGIDPERVLKEIGYGRGDEGVV